MPHNAALPLSDLFAGGLAATEKNFPEVFAIFHAIPLTDITSNPKNPDT